MTIEELTHWEQAADTERLAVSRLGIALLALTRGLRASAPQALRVWRAAVRVAGDVPCTCYKEEVCAGCELRAALRGEEP